MAISCTAHGIDGGQRREQLDNDARSPKDYPDLAWCLHARALLRSHPQSRCEGMPVISVTLLSNPRLALGIEFTRP